MAKSGDGKNNSWENPDNTDKIKKVRDLAGKNKAAALGLAVFLTLSTTLTGCGGYNEEEDEDDSYYGGGGYHGGSYFFYSGGSYRQSSWGKSKGSFSGGGRSTYRGGSIGG